VKTIKEDYLLLNTDLLDLGVHIIVDEEGNAEFYDDSSLSFYSWNCTYDEVYEELYVTWRNRLKFKHYTMEAYLFERNLGQYLDRLTRKILSLSWKPKGYFDFPVYHPKRIISAPYYLDRVVEEWITERFVKPYLEPKLHPSSVACRVGKGPPEAKRIVLDSLKEMYRKYGTDFYVFQYDIQGYYDNVNHDRIREQFSGMEALGRILFMNIIDDWHKSDGYAAKEDPSGSYGMPKGNLPSQWIGLAYLNDQDWMIDGWPGVDGHQVRYMDDGLVFFHTKAECKDLKINIEKYLRDNHMGIRLHPRKTRYFPISKGFTFCGWRYEMFSDGHVRLREKTERKNVTKKRLKDATFKYYTGRLSDADVLAKQNGTKAYLNGGDAKGFIRYLEHRFRFTHDQNEFYRDRTHEYKRKKKHRR